MKKEKKVKTSEVMSVVVALFLQSRLLTTLGPVWSPAQGLSHRPSARMCCGKLVLAFQRLVFFPNRWDCVLSYSFCDSWAASGRTLYFGFLQGVRGLPSVQGAGEPCGARFGLNKHPREPKGFYLGGRILQ